MNALAYCQLAVSKDSSRDNLCEVYRAETALYGTDGHRLHFCKGLPATAPHFPSGLDAQYPDCSAVMPKGEPISLATVKVSKEALAMLKSLAKVYGKSKHKTVSLTLDGVNFTLSGVHELATDDLRVSFSSSLPVVGRDKPPFSISVSIDYLIDALAIPKGKDATLADLEFRGENSPMVVLPYFAGLEHGTIGAVIMPMRSKD